jgi:uncharacterized protein (DUF302 family)
VVAYGTKVVVDQPWHEVLDRVREALADQDLIVLAELDLAEVLQEKLGVEIPSQVVLGVCRPALAHVTLQAEPSVGLLIPVHVVVRAEAPDVTVVEAADPVMLVAITGNPGLEPVAADCTARLRAALHSLLHPVDLAS